MWDWISRQPVRAALLTLMAAFAVTLTSCATRQPAAERDWLLYLGRTTHVDLLADRFTVTPVSDWRYQGGVPVAQHYGEAAYGIGQLRDVWFLLEPQPGSTLAAHTLLLFEFEGDRLLGLTIEARREADEDYSAWNGLWNEYELAYVWASARDLLTRRAVMLEHDIFVYPLALTAQQEQTLLTRVLQRTHTLETRPRFYNTLASNCTNELAKAARLNWNAAFVLTGLSDEHLFGSGVIPGVDFEETRTLANVTDFVRALNAEDGADFDAGLLGELRNRFGES